MRAIDRPFLISNWDVFGGRERRKIVRVVLLDEE